MSALVALVAPKVDQDWRTNYCKKGNCSLSLNDAPAQRLIVDLDRATLPIPPNQKRCDYLFVGGEDSTAWVVPIEMKGGGFKADDVAKQLQGGSCVAHKWLPRGSSFRFVPVLAHGKGAHPRDFRVLDRHIITLRGKKRRIKTLGCGGKLVRALKKNGAGRIGRSVTSP